MGPSEGSIEEPLTVLAELKRQGLIRHLGLSNVTPEQLAEAQTITEIVCVQNMYNVAHRNDDGFIDDLAAQGKFDRETPRKGVTEQAETWTWQRGSICNFAWRS